MANNPAYRGDTAYLAAGMDLIPVTPDDDNDLAVAARAIRCLPVTGAAGTLRVTTATGVVRNTEIDVGETLLLAIVRVHATGTDATGLEIYI